MHRWLRAAKSNRQIDHIFDITTALVLHLNEQLIFILSFENRKIRIVDRCDVSCKANLNRSINRTISRLSADLNFKRVEIIVYQLAIA